MTAGIALAILMLAVVPWPGRVTASATLRPVEIWPVFAPAGSQLISLNFREGEKVAAGAEILALNAPDLLLRQQAAQARLAHLRWQAASAGFDAESRNRLQSSQDELATATAELEGIEEELARDTPHAPFDGHLRDIDPDLRPGQWLARHERIAQLVGDKGLMVETYVDEESVKRIEVGDHGLFMVDSASGPVLSVTVANIDADASRVLGNRMLATPAGGHVLVRDKKGQRIPEQAIYRVSFTVDSPPEQLADQSWRGQVIVRARWEAPASRYLRHALAVLSREAGF